MLVQRIQSTNQIYKPMARKASEISKKKLQQISLAGMSAMMISEPIKANSVKCSGGEKTCETLPWSLVNPDLYNC